MKETVLNFVEKIRALPGGEKMLGLFFIGMMFWGVWYGNALDFMNEASHPALRLLLDIWIGPAWLSVSIVFIANLRSSGFLKMRNETFFLSLAVGIMTAFFLWSGTILGTEPLGLLPESITSWWGYENSITAGYWSAAVPLWAAYTMLEFLWDSKDIPMNSRITSILETLIVCILGLAMATGFAGGFAVIGIAIGVTIILVFGILTNKLKTFFKQPKVIIIPPEKNIQYNRKPR